MTNRTKTYIIMGDPTPLARGRYGRQGKVYDPQKHAKLLFGLKLKEQHGNDDYFVGPLHMDILMYMPLPESWSRNKKLKMRGTVHIKKPDLSNLLKFAEDCGNTILYEDDAIIYSGTQKKLYDDGNGPRTIITITQHT